MEQPPRNSFPDEGFNCQALEQQGALIFVASGLLPLGLRCRQDSQPLAFSVQLPPNLIPPCPLLGLEGLNRSFLLQDAHVARIQADPFGFILLIAQTQPSWLIQQIQVKTKHGLVPSF